MLKAAVFGFTCNKIAYLHLIQAHVVNHELEDMTRSWKSNQPI
jgi:hypothetical protein